jgi:hypothetical protein
MRHPNDQHPQLTTLTEGIPLVNEDDGHAFREFLFDFISLEPEDFSQAVIDLFGLTQESCDPTTLKSQLENALISKSEALVKYIKVCKRNNRLGDIIINEIMALRFAGQPALAIPQLEGIEASAIDNHSELSDVSRAIDLQLQEIEAEIFDVDWFHTVYDREDNTRDETFREFLQNAIENRWYLCFLSADRRQTLLLRYVNQPIIYQYM